MQEDLVDILQYKSENNNLNGIHTVTDCFSKYARCIPLKGKKGNAIINAFRGLFKNRKLKNSPTDKGKEFVMKKYKYFLRVLKFTAFHLKMN